MLATVRSICASWRAAWRATKSANSNSDIVPYGSVTVYRLPRSGVSDAMAFVSWYPLACRHSSAVSRPTMDGGSSCAIVLMREGIFVGSNDSRKPAGAGRACGAEPSSTPAAQVGAEEIDFVRS